MADPDGTRVGDAERQHVIDALRRATGEGRLTLDEFAERAGEVYAARTRGELDRVVEDLPPEMRTSGTTPAATPGTDTTPAATPGTGAPTGPAAGSTPEAPRRAGRRRFVAIMGGSRPRGRWRAAGKITAFAFWGGVTIDLRSALIETPTLDITAWAIMGGVHVVLPEGIPVELDGIVIMGGSHDATRPGRIIDGAPVVRVHARGLWGGVTAWTRREGRGSRSRHTHLHGHGGHHGRDRYDDAAPADDESDDDARDGTHQGGAPVPPVPPVASLPGPPAGDVIPPMPGVPGTRVRRPRPAHSEPGAAPAADTGPTASGTTPAAAAGPVADGATGASGQWGEPGSPPAAGGGAPATGAGVSSGRAGADGGRGANAPASGSGVAAARDTRNTGNTTDGDVSRGGAGGTAGGSATRTAGASGTADAGRTGTAVGSARGPAPGGSTLTVLVTDICRSTEIAAGLGDQRWLGVIQTHNALVREQIQRHRGTEVKAQGDGFLVTFTSARQAVLAGMAIQQALASYRNAHPEHQIELRAGIHTGEVVEDRGDVLGQNVVVAVRIADAARPGEVLVSSLTKDLTDAGGDLPFDDGRTVELKGVARPWRVHAVAWS